MGRALLAWEFGGDLGHARRVLSIARQLRAIGHEPALALADLAALDPSHARGLVCVQAPRLAMPQELAPSPLNASDILLNLGFADSQGLAGALTAWRGLLRLLQPDIVVADYAPTALLAARAQGISRVTVGTGFSNPPAGRPMPAFRSWIPAEPTALAERDARLLACVRESWLASDAQGMPPQDAAEIFSADAQLICAWPEVDPFGPREGVEYVGPQPDEAPAQAVSWQGDARPRIVAYLKPRDPRFELARRAIGRAAGEAVIAAPDLNARQAEALSSGRIRVVPGPVRLDLLDDAELCVSHGGPGIVWAAMRHGVPQALLPLQLEQYLVSRRAVAAGIAALLEPGEDHPDIDAWLQQSLGSAAMRAAAQDAARKLLRRTPANAGERIARAMKA